MKLNLDDLIAVLTANRRRCQPLSPYERAVVCSLLATGQSLREVARHFRVSHQTIAHTIEHWEKHHTFESKPKSGRKPVLSRADKRYIINLAKRNRDISRKALVNAVGKKVSYSTVKRCLLAKDRFDFACDWLENIEKLLQTMFSDESSCQNSTSNPTAWRFRFPAERWSKLFVNLKNHVKRTLVSWSGE
ncbi:transposase [Rhypophila decipiens]